MKNRWLFPCMLIAALVIVCTDVAFAALEFTPEEQLARARSRGDVPMECRWNPGFEDLFYGDGFYVAVWLLSERAFNQPLSRCRNTTCWYPNGSYSEKITRLLVATVNINGIETEYWMQIVEKRYWEHGGAEEGCWITRAPTPFGCSPGQHCSGMLLIQM